MVERRRVGHGWESLYGERTTFDALTEALPWVVLAIALSAPVYVVIRMVVG